MPIWQVEKIKELQRKIEEMKKENGEKIVRKLRSRLDEKQIEIINILDNKRKESKEKEQQMAVLEKQLEERNNTIEEMKKEMKNLELKNSLLTKSKRDIEKYIQTRSMSCTACGSGLLRSHYGSALNCGHILCMNCTKRMFNDHQYHDPLYPLRLYSKKDGNCSRVSCPQCNEMSEFCTSIVFQ